MTKRESKATLAERDRPAIEITPAMVEAGVDAYWGLDVEEVGSTTLVTTILRAALVELRDD